MQGEELRESDSPSWFNPIEIVQASQYLSDLYNEGLTPGDVGIITPYRKQVEKLRRFFTMMSIPPCKVGSVEEFQGQERIAIIVSTVRTQSSNLTFEQNIGFLSQPKRFNVTVTRAKHALIVVGDPNLLSK
ncbi:MOV10L1, partial [Cordylochernes scorpioides]